VRSCPLFGLSLICSLYLTRVTAAPLEPLRLWPGSAPGESAALPPESDTTGPTGRLVAGARVTRITNVSAPTLTVYRPAPERDTHAAVIICPGGGYKILAIDLEGTEVAAWLNRIGVTGIVLKYRVPTRAHQPRWQAPVQDVQRAMSLVRSRASDWGLDPARIGVCGFSAGGNAAGLAATFGNERKYPAADAIDRFPCRPDFGLLIYPAYFVDSATGSLESQIKIPADMPPQFIVQNDDDPISLNALVFATELKRRHIPVELHLYTRGGHGIGLRPVPGLACTTWPEAAEAWLRTRQLIK
jgi:acetyl esterase/lipase